LRVLGFQAGGQRLKSRCPPELGNIKLKTSSLTESEAAATAAAAAAASAAAVRTSLSF